MDGEQTLNMNGVQCIKTASNLTKTVYYNICNGTQTEVPYGAWDWAGIAFFSVLGVVIILFTLGILLMMLSDI